MYSRFIAALLVLATLGLAACNTDAGARHRTSSAAERSCRTRRRKRRTDGRDAPPAGPATPARVRHGRYRFALSVQSPPPRERQPVPPVSLLPFFAGSDCEPSSSGTSEHRQELEAKRTSTHQARSESARGWHQGDSSSGGPMSRGKRTSGDMARCSRAPGVGQMAQDPLSTEGVSGVRRMQGRASKSAAVDHGGRPWRAQMKWDRIEANWNKLRELAKQKWSKLTDDQFDLIAGKRDELLELAAGAVRHLDGRSRARAAGVGRAWCTSGSGIRSS